MKKLFVMFMVLMLISATALCEGYDLVNMTLDELVSLRRELNAEIASRINFDPMAIYEGEYIVGLDIQPGEYLVYNDDQKFGAIQIIVEYPAESDREALIARILKDRPYYLKLEDESIVKVTNVSSAHIEIIATPEWAQ